MVINGNSLAIHRATPASTDKEEEPAGLHHRSPAARLCTPNTVNKWNDTCKKSWRTVGVSVCNIDMVCMCAAFKLITDTDYL